MKRFITLMAVVAVALGIYALPDWPRKYATGVIRGRVINLPEGAKMDASVFGSVSESSIKGEGLRGEWDDTTHVFSLKWDICSPKKAWFSICGVDLTMPLCPGDTVDIEMDYTKVQQYKEDKERLYEKAVKVSGASFALSPEYRVLFDKLNHDAHHYANEYLKEYCLVGYDAYREKEWERHQQRIKQMKASGLKKQEKELMQLALEEGYIASLYNYEMLMSYSGYDSATIASAQRQFTAVDPHAPSLLFPKSINGAYIFRTGHLEYLEANGLDDLPLGRYLKERKQAETLVAEIKALRHVESDDIDRLSPEFRQPLHELYAEMADKREKNAQWQPVGGPDTWLKQIVDRHGGRIVFIDYWATWCGPCQLGIKEMAKEKDEYEKRGVDFVYITDNSSTTEGFFDLKQKHRGDHFLFTKKDIGLMNIPGFARSIPHYLIYGRDGRLIKVIKGWRGLETMTKELDEALSE